MTEPLSKTRERNLRHRNRAWKEGDAEDIASCFATIDAIRDELATARSEATRLSNYETSYNNLRRIVNDQYNEIGTLEHERTEARRELEAVTLERGLALASSQANRLGLCATHDATIRCDMPCPLCEIGEARETLAEVRNNHNLVVGAYESRTRQLRENLDEARAALAEEKVVTGTATRAMEGAEAALKALRSLAYAYLDFTSNCGDDGKCITCGEQWYPNKCEATCLHAMLFKVTREANDASMVWLELCDERDDAVASLKEVREKVLRPDKRLHQYEADIHQSDCGACDLLDILKDKTGGE